MVKSTLVEILRACSRKELRDIRKWLISPAHNLRKDVVALFDYLSEHMDGAPERLEKEAAWQAVFPGEAFDDARMRQTMYFLLKSVEDYFAHIELTKDPVRVQHALASVYRLRQLDKPFRLTLDAAKRQLESSPFRDSNYFLDKFTLEQEQYFYLATLKRSAELNLQEVSDELDLAYITNKLRLACRMKSHEAVYKKADYNFDFLPALLALVDQKQMLSTPAIAVYYYGYKALTNREDVESFNNMEKIIFSSIGLFPIGEQREVFLQAINYCIGRLNAGNKPFARRAFELFRKGFETAIFLENDILSRFTFANAFAVALLSKEFDWAEKFISDFQHCLEEKHRKSVVHFHQARLYFEKGDYGKAQQLLRQFEYDDMLQNIIAKTMLLKIYFEQGALDAFESLLESMRTYLQRKEALDPGRKAAYKNTISLMKRLLHLNPYSKTQVEKLRQLILDTNPLMERDWLLRQLDKK